MAQEFISEPLQPDTATFDPLRMSFGEPGLPGRFRWKKETLEVAEVLETWKEYGDCRNGSGERYVRKHGFRVRTGDGREARIYFQRSFGKSRASARWWLYSIE